MPSSKCCGCSGSLARVPFERCMAPSAKPSRWVTRRCSSRCRSCNARASSGDPNGSGLVDMSPEPFGSPEEALALHDLHLLEHRRVTHRLGLADGAMHLSNGTRAKLPEHPQHFELGIGRRRGLSWDL